MLFVATRRALPINGTDATALATPHVSFADSPGILSEPTTDPFARI
jgi:hypothetical protein